MKCAIYQVDAFTEQLFSGNPAAVCLLDSWIDERLMQAVAGENNLAETAFVVPQGEGGYEIRWFTPTVEVDLCGHATLAAAFVLFNVLHHPGGAIRFHSPRSGRLAVEKQNGMLFLDFPTDTPALLPDGQNTIIGQCIGMKPKALYRSKFDYMAVIDSEIALQTLQPDLSAISELQARGLIVTAKGDSADFVSRFFAPQSGIDEDPVTGSAHTALIPFWAEKLGKTRLSAKQISKRGGRLACELKGDRCLIGGQARLYMAGEINLC
jgi:PhzF family phenazine biosynthesis protein